MVTTSAVDAVSAVDRSVRGVAGAVSWPVRKISSFTTGVKHGAASYRTERDVSRAYDVGRGAAERRSSDIEEGLAETEAGSDARPPSETSTVASDRDAETETQGGRAWMKGEETDRLARARSAGRRRAQAEAGTETDSLDLEG